jgi:hypothetical protein
MLTPAMSMQSISISSHRWVLGLSKKPTVPSTSYHQHPLLTQP